MLGNPPLQPTQSIGKELEKVIHIVVAMESGDSEVSDVVKNISFLHDPKTSNKELIILFPFDAAKTIGALGYRYDPEFQEKWIISELEKEVSKIEGKIGYERAIISLIGHSKLTMTIWIQHFLLRHKIFQCLVQYEQARSQLC